MHRLPRLLRRLSLTLADMDIVEMHEAFAGQVAAYDLLPYEWNFVVAAILPFVEIIVGAHLVSNRWVRAAALVVLAATVATLIKVAKPKTPELALTATATSRWSDSASLRISASPVSPLIGFASSRTSLSPL